MVCARVYKCPPAGHARPGLRGRWPLAGAAAPGRYAALRPGPGAPRARPLGAGCPPGGSPAAAGWGPPGRCVAAPARSPGPWVLRPGVRCLRAAPARRGGPWPLPPCLGPGRPAPGPPPPARPSGAAAPSLPPARWGGAAGRPWPAWCGCRRRRPPGRGGRAGVGGCGCAAGCAWQRSVGKGGLLPGRSCYRALLPLYRPALAYQGQGCCSCGPGCALPHLKPRRKKKDMAPLPCLPISQMPSPMQLCDLRTWPNTADSSWHKSWL